QRVKHRRVETHPAPVHGRGPVEHLDCRRHRNHEAHEGEYEPGEYRLSADEHVVAPDEEADHGNGNCRPGDEFVAEDCLARINRDQLADHTHAGQNHDVDGGVRV